MFFTFSTLVLKHIISTLFYVCFMSIDNWLDYKDGGGQRPPPRNNAATQERGLGARAFASRTWLVPWKTSIIMCHSLQLCLNVLIIVLVNSIIITTIYVMRHNISCFSFLLVCHLKVLNATV